MRWFATVPYILLAASKKPVTWYVDGNNVLAHKSTTKDRDSMAEKLQLVQKAEAVNLVFDGRPGEETTISQQGKLRIISLGEGMISDDFIIEEIHAIERDPAKRNYRVNLVSADRQLRQQSLKIKPTVQTVVNPVTFWKKYLPRLAGFKDPKLTEEEATTI